MHKFLSHNKRQWRMTRTVVQGVIAMLIANVDLILGWCVLNPSARRLIVALVMVELDGDPDETAEIRIPKGGE